MDTNIDPTDAPENPETTATQPEPGAKADPAPEKGADPAPTLSGDPDPSKTAKPEPDAAKAEGALQALRETLAGGDEGLLKALERYKSTEAISKAFREARQAAKAPRGPMRLGDKPTDDEVKAYREALGIPDEPDAYPVAFREDFPADDESKTILGEFKTAMHGRNVDPKAAEAALEWYQDFAVQQVQELNATLAKTAKETQAALRTEWGGEYDANIGAAGELMKTHLGEDGFSEMMGLRLQDGSRLQDNIAFVKMMAQIGSDYYGSNAIYSGDIETTSKTVQERIDELLKLRAGNSEDQQKFFSDGVQAEITKLYAQRDKINARK